MLFKRREFLQVGSLATASLLLPKFLKAFEAPAFVPPGNKVLVVLQLGGGNDGLNTVVPVRNDIYYRARPKLALAREKTIALTDEAGLHPALTAFADAYHNGSMALFNAVGYPNPERSHFRSMDIWHSGSHANQYINTGWIGRYLDAQCAGCARPTQALEFDDTLSLALKGEQMNGLALRDPRALLGTTNEKFFRDVTEQHLDGHGHEQPADYLYKTLSSTLSGADYIFKKSKIRGSQSAYPNTALGKGFRTIGSLVLSDIDTKVYYVSLPGFDTHINQEGQHARVLKDVNDAVDAFIKDMKAAGRWNDVLLMTFSEFGRRVAQNASGGTDHGAANNMFLFGGSLKQQGMLNGMADLTDLDDGDLKYQLDFKQVYATVLNKWLGTDDKAVLGEKFSHLKFI